MAKYRSENMESNRKIKIFEKNRLHLICNAHVDPVWQWTRDEGIAAALSTFESAVRLSKQYDYIFCHNEAFLYEYVEEYSPELFSEIKRLIAAGKWHIMGGWYLQPDCNMPSGESIIRQIEMGREYFFQNSVLSLLSLSMSTHSAIREA